MRKMIWNTLFILILAISFFAHSNVVKAQTIYSAFNDFSGVSNPTLNGVWRYGYTHSLGGPLILYTSTGVHGHYDPSLTPWTDGQRIDPNVIKNETGQDVSLPLSGFFVIPATDYLYFHPSPEGDYSVIRWNAPSLGSYEVAAVFRAPINTCPTTADAHILHNGISLFDALIEQDGNVSDQDPRTFTTVLSMSAGDTIDFTVGVGSNSNFACDRVLLKATIAQSLIYDFQGFFPPVDNLPTLNFVTAGRAIPVKFSLNGDQGLSIFSDGYPSSAVVTCGSTAADAIEETISAGSSSLTYDAITDQYTYIWKTERAWTGTCRTLVLKLRDGAYHQANFRFK